MSGYYMVQINLSKSAMFVVVKDCGGCNLIHSKSDATKFDSQGVADLVSNYFWEHHWERFEHLDLKSREVVFIHERKSRRR